MFWTKKEREDLWQWDQVRFAEIAHNYACCDVPTITQCLLCTHDNKCKNKAEIFKALANYKEWRNGTKKQSAPQPDCPYCAHLAFCVCDD